MGIGSPSSKFEPADLIAILDRAGSGIQQLHFREGEIIFTQGQPANRVFYIRRGKVIQTRVSSTGKTGVVSVLGPQEFFGLSSIVGASERDFTASAMTNCFIACIDRGAMLEALR